MNRRERNMAAGLLGLGIALAVLIGLVLAHHFRSQNSPASGASGPTGPTAAAPAAAEELEGKIIVHVFGHRPGPHGKKFAWTEEPLLITRLGPKGEALPGAIQTPLHTLNVPVGEFWVTVPGTPPQNGLPGLGQTVKIMGKETVNITITVPIK